MTEQELLRLKPELDRFLAEYAPLFGREENQQHARLFVQGLLEGGDRRNTENIAQAINGCSVRNLQAFISTGVWEDAELLAQMRRDVLAILADPDGLWNADETGFPKKGDKSVGVKRQYSGTLGKTGNCQVTVNCHYAERTIAWPVATRLYLPESWANDADRRQKAKVPEEVVFQTKPQIALDLLDKARSWGVRWACVTADADYGDNPNFLAGLEKRRQLYVVAVRCAFAVGTSRRGGEVRRADELIGAQPARSWRSVTWREGSQGWMRGKFVALRVWRVDASGRRRAGWLIGEDSSDGKRRYYWSNFGEGVPLERLVEYAHRRHWVEQYHEEAKGLLGWDQYQGRLWPGFHRHAVTVMLAYSFLVWQEWRQRQERARSGRPRRPFSPRPDRRRMSLPEVHRQITDWLRIEAARELLLRELMTVPERIPA
jgi:SRSO17 transposase